MSRANLVHGRYSRETVKLRRMLAEERRNVREWLRMVAT
jgi:hypothetical protein